MEYAYKEYIYSPSIYVLFWMSIFFFFYSQPSKASDKVTPIDSLRKLLMNPSLPVNKQLQASIKLAELYFPVNADSAAFYATQSLKLTAYRTETSRKAMCINRLGEAYHLQGKFAQSIETAQKAYTLAKADSNVYEMAYSTNLIGKSVRKEGNFASAFRYFLTYLKMSEKLKDTIGIAKAFNNMGVIYMDQKNYPLALEHFQKALRLQLPMKKPPMLGTTMCNVACIHMWQGNYKQATVYFNQALNLPMTKSTLLQLAQCHHGLGHLNRIQKNYSLTIFHYTKALDISKLLKNNGEVVRYATDLSASYMDVGNLKAAEKLALVTLKLATQIHTPKDAQVLSFMLRNENKIMYTSEMILSLPYGKVL